MASDSIQKLFLKPPVGRIPLNCNECKVSWHASRSPAPPFLRIVCGCAALILGRPVIQFLTPSTPPDGRKMEESKADTDGEASMPSRKAPRLLVEKDALDADPTATNKDELNAELWGELQLQVPLELIHEKLSQPDLLRLRLVCKDWNRAAMRGLLPRPYFVTITSGYHEESDDPMDDQMFLNGVVSYDEASGTGSFMHQRSRLPDVQFHAPPFAVEGLILCHTRGEVKQRGVFNVHNQTWHAVPPPPFARKRRSACGLMVDTAVRPYAFKLVEGSNEFNTQVYDSESRAWSTTSSRLSSEAVMREVNRDTSYNCICNNGEIYISLGAGMVLKYSMKADMWTTVALPEKSDPCPQFNGLGCYIGVHNTLGVWEGRNFITTQPMLPERSVIVWEMVDPEKQKWEEYARMSRKKFIWLFENNYWKWSASRWCCSGQRLLLCFCDGFLLVCCWQWTHSRADALMVFDMAKKTWKKVRLPMGTVRTYCSPESEKGPCNPWYTMDSCPEDYEYEDSAEESEDFNAEDW